MLGELGELDGAERSAAREHEGNDELIRQVRPHRRVRSQRAAHFTADAARDLLGGDTAHTQAHEDVGDVLSKRSGLPLPGDHLRADAPRRSA